MKFLQEKVLNDTVKIKPNTLLVIDNKIQLIKDFNTVADIKKQYAAKEVKTCDAYSRMVNMYLYPKQK